MTVNIKCDQEYLKAIITDISSVRRGKIDQINEEKGNFNNSLTNLQCFVPLEEMVGYTSFLRSTTKGEGYFIMKFHSYNFVGGLK